jgi:hypothetical protein
MTYRAALFYQHSFATKRHQKRKILTRRQLEREFRVAMTAFWR